MNVILTRKSRPKPITASPLGLAMVQDHRPIRRLMPAAAA